MLVRVLAALRSAGCGLSWTFAVVGASLLCLWIGGRRSSLEACPFCQAVSLTFSEEIAQSPVAVIAVLKNAPAKQDDIGAIDESSKATLEIVDVLKGEEILGKTKQFRALLLSEAEPGAKFFVLGLEPKNIIWATPIAVSDRGVKYLRAILKLPKDGPSRTAFFLDYLEDSDEMLARDAYDEFARTPYDGVKAVRASMPHDKLLAWVRDPKVSTSHRRLYLTMLGAYGDKNDAPVLEEIINSKQRELKSGLDAVIAAYLTLKGPEGVPLIEQQYLKNPDAEYTDTYAAVMAIRFHGQEEKIIPRERLLEALRYMLDRKQLEDLVIPDLARWQDWSVVDRLVKMFKESEDESSWVRVPVINYLKACPLPEAKKRLEELAKLNPEAVKQAEMYALPAASGATRDDKTKPPAANGSSSEGPEADDGAALESVPANSNVNAAAEATSETALRQRAVAVTARRPLGSLPATVEKPVVAWQVVTAVALGGLAFFAATVAILRTGQRLA